MGKTIGVVNKQEGSYYLLNVRAIGGSSLTLFPSCHQSSSESASSQIWLYYKHLAHPPFTLVYVSVFNFE